MWGMRPREIWEAVFAIITGALLVGFVIGGILVGVMLMVGLANYVLGWW